MMAQIEEEVPENLDAYIQSKDALSDEIKDEVYVDYYLAETVKRGVAYHMGYLPSALRLRIEELFRQEGKIHTIVCTSTLLEGVIQAVLH